MKRNDYQQAVALSYGQRKTPVVSAKGSGELAEAILEEARKHGVHVAEDPELLASLARLRIDEEIPPELYTTVAVVLSWAYWLKGMRPGDEKKSRPGPGVQASL